MLPAALQAFWVTEKGSLIMPTAHKRQEIKDGRGGGGRVRRRKKKS